MTKVEELSIPGAWVFTPRLHHDDRGTFLEWYKAELVHKAVGHALPLVQANHSISKRGVVRGIHFADVPPGQAKYVYCPRGAVLDYVVDVRLGSPTFGKYEGVRLDDMDRRAVYLSEGLGHAFVALTDDAAVTYLCSTEYDPKAEHTVDALDPEIGIDWGLAKPLLSERDAAAPALAEVADAGLLPDYDECVAYQESLRS